MPRLQMLQCLSVTSHFCGKFLKLFPPLLGVHPLIYSFTNMRSPWLTRVNFSAHSIWCGLQAVLLLELWDYAKSELDFLYFK